MPLIDRTKLTALLGNLIPTITASSAKIKDAILAVYDNQDANYNELLALRAEPVTSTKLTDGSVTTPKLANGAVTAAKMDPALMTDNVAFNIHRLNAVLDHPDGSVTMPKLATDVASKVNQAGAVARDVANLKAVSTIANRVDGASGIFYDLNDGLNAGSIAKIDLTKTIVSGATAAGATTVTVTSVTGLAAGQEVTLFDDVNLERPIIASINTGTKQVTFTAALTKAYKDGASLCRSSVVQDTTNKLLKFGGWGNSTTCAVTSPTTVVASAYDTSGNGGRKLVRLASGNIYSAMRNGTTDVRIYKSTDNGATWTLLVTAIVNATDISLVTNGIYIYAIYGNGTTAMVANGYDESGVQITNAALDSVQTAIGNNSLAINSAGTELYAAWASKNSTYPNSFNIRYAKGTIAGNGTVTWGAVVQISNNNTAGQDIKNPCIVVRSNNNPVIVCEYHLSDYQLVSFYFNGTSWSAPANIYSGVSYVQSFPAAIVKQNGSNIGRIISRWHGLDATDAAKQNERWSYSDDGGITWSGMVKITTGNTVDRQKGVLAEDVSGNIYNVYMDGAGISYQQLPNGSTTWGVAQSLNATGTNPAVLERLDFSVPPTAFMDASQVKFKGTWQTLTNTPVLVEDARYNIAPANNVSNAVAWVDRETDAGLSLAAALSIHSTTESFTAMAKITATVDGTTSEDQFTAVGTPNTKSTLRITMTRTATSINKSIKSVMGAVGT